MVRPLPSSIEIAIPETISPTYLPLELPQAEASKSDDEKMELWPMELVAAEANQEEFQS